MNSLREVEASEDCPVCGCSVVTIHTDIDQEPDLLKEEGWEWVACDGDRVSCPECDNQGQVNADESGAWISMCEGDDHGSD